MAPADKTLTEQSRETRLKLRPIRSYGDALAAGFAARERRQIFALALTAASLAAAERKRHGRDSSPEEKSDAAQDALVWAYGSRRDLDAEELKRSRSRAINGMEDRCECSYDGPHWKGDRRCAHCGGIRRADQPTVADLTDPDRPSVSSFDGSREGLRPCREMIAAAGASLDAAHSGRVLMDPAAGDGDLLAASAASREAGDARRSVAPQLVDPSVSPIPPTVADAIRQAGIWPDDPTRQAMLDVICPDLTAQDWLEAGEKGNKPTAITKRRERGKGMLEVDPKAKTAADLLAASIEPTPAERREAETVAAERLLTADPDGPRRAAAKMIDTAWRTAQPTITPLKICGAEVDKSA